MELSDLEASFVIAGVIVLAATIHWMVVIYDAARETRDYYRRRNTEDRQVSPGD